MRITICGGGNGAHTLAGITSMNNDMAITVLDIYEDESERWSESLVKKGFIVNFQNESKLTQPAGCVKFSITKDPKVVENADIVILCIPAYTHELYLQTVIPHLQNECTVIGMPGQPGFEYQCLFHLKKHNKACNIMSLETLPWACRIVNYGTEVMVVGTKEKVQASFVQRNTTEAKDVIYNLQCALGKFPVLQQVPHVLILTLATKASVHPPIMYATWKDWDGQPLDTAPLFYQGVDEAAADILDNVTDEITAISTAVKAIYPQFDFSGITSMKGWLIEHYGDQIKDKTSLLSSLKTNKAYDGLKHPVKRQSSGKYVPDFNYRYLSEDVPYGIVVLRAIADLVGLQTPKMDKIIEWAQGQLGRKYLSDGKMSFEDSAFTRLPQTFGIDSIETLVKIFD